MLCAYGITKHGKRELTDFMRVQAESEANCEMFLEHLNRRGLLGSNLELIITDGSPGLIRPEAHWKKVRTTNSIERLL